MEAFLIRVLQFMMAISLLVLLHELGHFTFAKLFKVRVTKFYLFFNPKFHLLSTYDTWLRRLLKLKPDVVPTKKDEDGNEVKEYVGTEYGLGWLPLGGYCAIDGMIDETNQKLSAETHPWEFRTKPVWQRLLIMIGGVLVNFLLALFIYSMILFWWGDTYVPAKNTTLGMKFNKEAKALGFADHDIPIMADGDSIKSLEWSGGLTDALRSLSTARQVTVLRADTTVKDGVQHYKEVVVNTPGDLDFLDMISESPAFALPFMPAEIDSVVRGTPTYKAGLRDGDKVLAVNNKAVDSWNEVNEQVGIVEDVYFSKSDKAEPAALPTVTLVVQHAQTEAVDTVNVQLAAFDKKHLGFADIYNVNPYRNYEKRHVDYGIVSCIPAGIAHGTHTLSGYVRDLKYVFTSKGFKSLGGFGAIGSLFPAQWNWHRFWEMTAFLSIILAFMNILPIPALDGGHVLFLLYELITRRKPSEEFMIRAEYIGFGILILLMVVANLNDVLRWLGIM